MYWVHVMANLTRTQSGRQGFVQLAPIKSTETINKLNQGQLNCPLATLGRHYVRLLSSVCIPNLPDCMLTVCQGTVRLVRGVEPFQHLALRR